MNVQYEDLARAMVEERLASAQRRQVAVQAGRARSAERRAVASRWWRRLLRRRPVGDASPAVTTPGPGPVGLETMLDRTAQRIVEDGTRAESATLRAMSEATGHLSPGAAAALVDWDGSEPARLRAFGIVHGVILRDLSARDRSRLLARLIGTEQPEGHTVTAMENHSVASASDPNRRPSSGRRGEAA